MDDLELTGFTYADASEIAKELSTSIDDVFDDEDDEDDSVLLGGMNLTGDDALKEDFIMPPFTVLNQGDNDWKELRRGWLDIIERDVDKFVTMIEDYPSLCLDPVLAEILISWFTPNVDKVNVLDCFADDCVFGYVASSKDFHFTGVCLDDNILEFPDRFAILEGLDVLDLGILIWGI